MLTAVKHVPSYWHSGLMQQHNHATRKKHQKHKTKEHTTHMSSHKPKNIYGICLSMETYIVIIADKPTNCAITQATKE